VRAAVLQSTVCLEEGPPKGCSSCTYRIWSVGIFMWMASFSVTASAHLGSPAAVHAPVCACVACRRRCRCGFGFSHNVVKSTRPVLQDTEEARTKHLFYYKYMASSRNQPTSPRVKINARGNVGRP
jgi:hypothetical protein